MFLGAISFYQDLCDWRTFTSGTTTVTNAFAGTACPDTSDQRRHRTVLYPMLSASKASFNVRV